LQLLERKRTLAEIVATLTTLTDAIAMPADQTPRTAAARRSLREKMLAEYFQAKPKLGRSTATFVAKKFANSPIEVANLVRALRRWVAEEKGGQCQPPQLAASSSSIVASSAQRVRSVDCGRSVLDTSNARPDASFQTLPTLSAIRSHFSCDGGLPAHEGTSDRRLSWLPD
jgi:hypothetical protein